MCPSSFALSTTLHLVSTQRNFIASCGGEPAKSLGSSVYIALCPFLLPFELQLMCECVQLLTSSLSDIKLNEGNFSEETWVIERFADVRSAHGNIAPRCRLLVSVFPLCAWGAAC